MAIVQRGRISGRTIKLDEPTGLPDGAEVVIRIEGAEEGVQRLSKEQWLASPVFGMWADREDMADPAEWVRKQREAWQERLDPDR